MTLVRCDECCDVLDGIDDGTVYECDKQVESKLGLEHICEDCLRVSEDLRLINPSAYCLIVVLKEKEK